MNFWDQQFALPEFKYGKQSNRFLQEQAFRLPPLSQVLLPGDGEGRNSVWLAGLGHRVTAMDQSAVGLDKALRLAAENNVVVDVVHADLEHWEPEPASVDAVVLTYVHLPVSFRSQAHARLMSALRPGGWFILEAFHPRQLGYTSGGPKMESMLYTLANLRADLSGEPALVLQEFIVWEGEVLLDEGGGHQGQAFVTRYVAQRAA